MKTNSSSRSAFFVPPILAWLAHAYFGLCLTATAANPVPLINQPLVPAAVAPGGAEFTLTVNGTGFVAGSVVNWNGSSRTTTVVNGSQLTATIPGSDIATAGTASVTVVNPALGGGTSNVVFFAITFATSSVSLDRSDYTVPSNPSWMVTADFNGDARQDLASANGPSNTVSILIGNGDGTFQSHIDYATDATPGLLRTGDFNGDGIVDLVTSNNFSTVSVLLGNGDGSFGGHIDSPAGSNPAGMVTGDFNGDGKLDLAVTEPFGGNTVAILLGNGDGSFQAPVQYATGLTPGVLTTGDFNGDRKLDLAVPDEDCCAFSVKKVSILLGNGDGTFQPHVDYTTGRGSIGAKTADFNGDGKLDLAVNNLADNTVSILLGNGDGTFQPHVDYATAVQGNGGSLITEDFNGDGQLDLITNNLDSGTISLLLGNGNGTFQRHVDYRTGPNPRGSTAGDFNADGRLELAVPNNGSNTVSVFLQTLPVNENCLEAPAGLVSWWSGDKTADDVQGTNNGVLKNGASFRPGMVGPGFLFDGIDDRVRIPNSTSLSQTRISVDAWIYVTGNANQNRRVIGKDEGEGSALREYSLGIDAFNKVQAFVTLPSGLMAVRGSTTIELNAWYHLAMTHDGLKLRLYVNGIQDGILDAVGDTIPTLSAVGIGADAHGGEFIRGIIDEAQIFNRALTDAEILAIYQAGADGQCKPNIFVASIEPSYTVSGHGFRISTSVLIQDVNGIETSGATLQVGVILPSGSNLTFPLKTDSTGKASLSFTATESGLYQFKVRNVNHPTREYDRSLNIETTDTLLIP